MNRAKRLVGLLAPVRPEPVMTLPRTVADVLSEHVVFEVECIDRMYDNVYVPGLQDPAGLVAYVHRQLGLPISAGAGRRFVVDRVSTAALGIQEAPVPAVARACGTW
jgi:hypothetical protein